MARAKAATGSTGKAASSVRTADAVAASSSTAGRSAKQDPPDATLVVIPSGTTPTGETSVVVDPPHGARPQPTTSSKITKASSAMPSREATRAGKDTTSTFSSGASDRDRRLFNKHTPVNFFPPIIIPKQLPVSRAERAQVRYLKNIRNRFHSGPLYAVVTDNAKLGSKRASIFDPFEDVDHYTKRFKQEPKSLAKFDTQSYCLDFFPDELQDAVSARPSGGPRQRQRKGRRLPEAALQNVAPDAEAIERGNVDKSNVDRAEDDDTADPDNADMSESNIDDDFEDDDSDMAGDYNAEGYFDAGEDDGDVLDGEGGEDAGGFD